MQLHCNTCYTFIPAANINIQQTLAVCPQCHTVFNKMFAWLKPKCARMTVVLLDDFRTLA